jgi:hypothetical protein
MAKKSSKPKKAKQAVGKTTLKKSAASSKEKTSERSEKTSRKSGQQKLSQHSAKKNPAAQRISTQIRGQGELA